MRDDTRRAADAPFDGAPTWVRILQAAIVGMIAGLALHVLFSMVVLQGRENLPRATAPAQCKKNNPARGAEAPPLIERQPSSFERHTPPRSLQEVRRSGVL